MPRAKVNDETGFNSTEDDILDTINDAPPTRVNNDEEDAPDDEVDPAAPKAPEDDSVDPDANAAGKKPDPKTKVEPKADPNAKPKAVKGVKAKPDETAAFARKQVEYNQRVTRERDIAQGQLRTVTTERDTLKASLESINHSGLPSDELAETARLGKLFKSDPVAVISELLTAAKEAGIDLGKLNLGTIDTNAIKNLITKEIGGKLNPITDSYNAQRLEQESVQSAQREVDDFVALNPEAEMHLPAMIKVVAAQPSLTLDQAWEKVQLWAFKNKVDLSTPPGSQQNRQQAAPKNQVRKPLTAGRNIANTGGEQQQIETAKAPAKYGQSIDEIIVDAMNENGIKYRR